MAQNVRCNSDSLPICLRHNNKWEALEHAEFLAEFLQSTTEVLFSGDLCPTENDVRGLSLCFDLLRDKLRIANDELDWPVSDFNSKNALRAVGPEGVFENGPDDAED